VLDFLGWLRPETLHCLRPLTSALCSPISV
jgi:hypothetical protein